MKDDMVRAEPKTVCTADMRPLDYHDGAIKVTNTVFYLNHITCGRPIATSCRPLAAFFI